MRLILGRALAIIGGACGWIATAVVFTLPMYEGVSVTVTSSGEMIEQHSRKTLLEVQSLEPITIFFFSAILLLSLAAAILAIRAKPILRPSNLTKGSEPSQGLPRRNGIAILAAGALLLFASFISGLSVGAFYLPGALVVFLAGILIALD